MNSCSDKACFVDDGEQCRRGEPDHTQCPRWSKEVVSETPIRNTPSIARRVPWSSSTLGLFDMAGLLPRTRSILVGVLGTHDAGKTTLLTGTYLSLLQGNQLAGAAFAGSRTIGAWESLAAWTRFDDAARKPTFPPHTPRGTARIPGILHLALRDGHDCLKDVLLTDAPGEWFTRWSIRADAKEAAGARWITKHADAFIILADCKRLAGPERGQARSQTRQLVERLGNHVDGRPSVFVWAKSDHSISDSIRGAVGRAVAEHLPQAVEMSCTTDHPSSLSAVVAASLHSTWDVPRARRIKEPISVFRPFEAYRGRHDGA